MILTSAFNQTVVTTTFGHSNLVGALAIKINIVQYLLAFVSSAILVGLLTPAFRKLAIHRNIWDAPISKHKTHREPIPYLGGVAIAIGISLIIIAGSFFEKSVWHNISLAFSIIIPAAILGVIGLFDDINNLPAWPRFLAQSVAGVGISFLLIQTNNIGTPTGNKLFDFLIITIWVVGITNSINFFDNLDGGAAGTVGVSSFILGVLANYGNQYLIASFAFVISGAMVGFLKWNRSPARIYMGDAGALFLGVLLASLTIRLHPSVNFQVVSFATPIMLLAVPILDTTVAVTSRLRRGISPFQGGRDHLSHRLVRLGLSRPKAAVILWAFSGAFGLIAISVSKATRGLEITGAAIAALFWVGLYIFFIKRPDTD